ncbi:head decoration protein [Plantactinospora sp. CA-294935]|uniref:head decoration protein n=1 Tax=Plantactinospora sp. CA-294935 TaxID=3240012 RepID=UPI003D8BBB78
MNLAPVTEAFGQDDQSWLGSEEGTDRAISITLDTSAFNAGLHYPDGYFRSGIILGQITATGLYGPYNAAAADGTETAAGLLLCAVGAPSATTTDVQGAMLWHGRVLLSKLPIAEGLNGGPDAGDAYAADLPQIRFDA